MSLNKRELACVSILCATIPWVGQSMAQDSLISKSTTMYLADAVERQLQPKGLAYIPNGTRIAVLEKRVKYNGADRYLVLTETGMFGYLKKEGYWAQSEVDDLERKDQNLFIRREHPVNVDLPGGVLSINFKLSRGEKYKMNEEHENSYIIELTGSDKFAKLPESTRKAFEDLFKDISVTAKIPRSIVKRVDFSRAVSESTVNHFGKITNSGVRGVRRTCEVEAVKALKLRGGKDPNLSKFYMSLQIDGAEESSDIKAIKDKRVTREYYSRENDPGIYAITKIEGCGSDRGTLSYRYRNPADVQIYIDARWIADDKLPHDKRSGQLVISCPKDYFAIEDKLLAGEVEESEVAFVISRVARLKNYAPNCQH